MKTTTARSMIKDAVLLLLVIVLFVFIVFYMPDAKAQLSPSNPASPVSALNPANPASPFRTSGHLVPMQADPCEEPLSRECTNLTTPTFVKWLYVVLFFITFFVLGFAFWQMCGRTILRALGWLLWWAGFLFGTIVYWIARSRWRKRHPDGPIFYVDTDGNPAGSDIDDDPEPTPPWSSGKYVNEPEEPERSGFDSALYGSASIREYNQRKHSEAMDRLAEECDKISKQNFKVASQTAANIANTMSQLSIAHAELQAKMKEAADDAARQKKFVGPNPPGASYVKYSELKKMEADLKRDEGWLSRNGQSSGDHIAPQLSQLSGLVAATGMMAKAAQTTPPGTSYDKEESKTSFNCTWTGD